MKNSDLIHVVFIEGSHKNASVQVDEPKLRRLVDVFLEENKNLNLSAFRSPEHCWTGNVLDSVAFLQAFDAIPELKLVQSIADIGTGGGFPLMPLALCLPDVKCVGIDSTGKKLDAVQRIVDTMDSKNVELAVGRLEDFGHEKGFRGSFDLVTARALAPLSILLEYAIPLLRVGGLCAFWKSMTYADELAMSSTAQRTLHSPFLRTFEYLLPDGFGERTIIFFKKIKETPVEYPRKVGIPKLKPL